MCPNRINNTFNDDTATGASTTTSAASLDDPLKHLHTSSASSNQGSNKKGNQNSYLKELEQQIKEQRARKEQEKRDQVNSVYPSLLNMILI